MCSVRPNIRREYSVLRSTCVLAKSLSESQRINGLHAVLNSGTSHSLCQTVVSRLKVQINSKRADLAGHRESIVGFGKHSEIATSFLVRRKDVRVLKKKSW